MPEYVFLYHGVGGHPQIGSRDGALAVVTNPSLLDGFPLIEVPANFGAPTTDVTPLPADGT